MSPRLDSIVVSEVFLEIKSLVIYILNKYFERKQSENKLADRIYDLCMEVKHKYDPSFKTIALELELNDDNLNAVSRKIISRVLADKCDNGRILSIFVFSLSLLGNCEQIRIPYFADILSNNVASVIHSKSEHLDAWNIFIEQFIVF